MASARFRSKTLQFAAAYNLFWGAVVVLFPSFFFDVIDADRPLYPQIWQCVGMIVGVYGLGYAIAATNFVRHWPIVLVGFLGKIFGPIGFVWSVWQGVFPAEFIVVIIFNDLVWWIPFAYLLWIAFRENTKTGQDTDLIPSAEEALNQFHVSETSKSLFDLSKDQKLLLVFLRHSGCTFCRSTLDQLSKNLGKFRAANTQLVLVHMSPQNEFRQMLSSTPLKEAWSVSDPQRILYRAFSLARGGFLQLFGPKVWWRGFIEGVIRGFGVGKLKGDGFQLPGAFLVENGGVLQHYRPKSAAETLPLERFFNEVSY